MNDVNRLLAVNMGIDTHEEPVVYMRSDCDICRSEGFSANARVQVRSADKSIIATLNIVTADTLAPDTMGCSLSAWRYLGLHDEQTVTVQHAPVVRSLSTLRKKVHGHELSEAEIAAVIGDIARRLYSDIEIASFLTACAGNRLNLAEITGLTKAMIDIGNRLQWPDYPRVFDKHCVGGLPGNRTTPIVIAVGSAAGLIMPKTSSRAITSPAGTADTMEVLTRVDMNLEEMQQVVRSTGACLAWGGRVKLSPTDDLLIRIEKALDLDGEGQLIASVLSKKIAAGSTDILIDIPVGPTAKVRNQKQAQRLSGLFTGVAKALGVQVHCVITDGSQAVGRGIGPAEEARDVLAVLRNDEDAPQDLKERALFLSAQLLSMASGEDLQLSATKAQVILHSGKALEQFERICQAQGVRKEIPDAPHSEELTASSAGHLLSMDNRRLAQLAKLAGAPSSPVSGLRLQVRVGDTVRQGQTLARLFAATSGELAYARAFYHDNRDLFNIGD